MSAKALTIGPRLFELEQVIERGMASFVEVGNALLEIREKRLYRERECKTFDDYCREHWGWNDSRARQLMRSAAAVKEIEESAGNTLPPIANARQADQLARAEAPAEVWAEVVEQHAPAEITAAVIREHVEARKPQAEPAEVVQDTEVLDLADVLDGIAYAVSVAKTAGATSQEMYDAYQRGLQ